MFHRVVDVLLLNVLNVLCKWRARRQISLHRDNKVVLYCTVLYCSQNNKESPDTPCLVLTAPSCHRQTLRANSSRTYHSGTIPEVFKTTTPLTCQVECLVLRTPRYQRPAPPDSASSAVSRTTQRQKGMTMLLAQKGKIMSLT